MNRLVHARHRVRRAVLARRRMLAAVLAAAAVATGLQAASPAPPATTPVLTAARDLPGGSVVHDADLVRREFDPDSVPAGVVGSAAQVVGRTTAAPVRAGEPLTDVRLVSGSILAGYPGAVAAPVRIGDPGMVDLLRVGDIVDVIAADPQGRTSGVVVANDAPVIAVPEASDDAPTGVTGGLVLLAVSTQTSLDLAEAGVASYLSVTLTR